MKYNKGNTNTALTIPAAVMDLSGVSGSDRVEMHILSNAVVALKGRMTAMEMVEAVTALGDLATELAVHLSKVCGRCEMCGNCEDCTGDPIVLPDYLREKADIPLGAKLCAYVDEEEGIIHITEADYHYDLSDVPREMLETFDCAGVCIGTLEKLLIVDEIIYGE